MRSAGILMPITSLPSKWGIGTLGQAARDFVDFLWQGGQSYWQILPIFPTSYGDSPYQTFSSYAGNPYLIDLDDLAAEGLLRPAEYQHIHWGNNLERIDYGLIYQNRFKVLKNAADRVVDLVPNEYNRFCEKESAWLDDYSLFMALKDKYAGVSWQFWPDELRRRQPAAIADAKEELSASIRFWQAIQFLFFRQWFSLKHLAGSRGIEIIGDLPIYVSADSADIWAHPEQFQLDNDLRPQAVAGCPPDGFSADGQLWGNPLFDWEFIRQEGYSWWIDRIAYQFKIYDVLRIDHFRAFDSFYAIPVWHSDARNGEWKPGPGMEFFEAVEAVLGKRRIIAEDLGFLTASVHRLLEQTGYPGMKVLEFAFDSRDTGAGYLPHSYPRNCVVYTGTHDNDTVLGWISSAPRDDVQYAIRYLRLSRQEGYHWGMMRSAWSSVADLAIIQLQDLLGLGSEARINVPSTVGGNWVWRCRKGDFNSDLADKLFEEMKLYHRLPE